MHIDCIQTHVVRNINIWNNVCVIDSGVYGNAMILGMQSRPGTIDTSIIYNNYIYGGGHLQPGGNPNVSELYLRWYGYVNSVYPATFVYQNTVVAANGGSFSLYHEMPAIVKNNILIQMGTNGENPNIYGGAGLEAWYSGFNSSWYIKANESTNNLLWSKYSGSLFVGNQFMGVGGSPVGTPSSWSEWVSAYGATGVNANPFFVNNVQGRYGYVIGSNSPAMYQGENLQSFIESKGLPWTDIEGKPRGSSPTLGAYEYERLLGSGNELEALNFKLEQNYPNPFNPTTTIGFSLPAKTYLRINVYNMLGELVEKLAEGTYEAGYHQLNFDAADLTSGVYIYRIESDAFVQVKKMILLR
jgi:hypothetical protein